MTFDLENPRPIAGDALRDEVALLLEPRFGRPIREKFIAGKKVDLCFQRQSFGRPETVVVETKDYNSNLGRRGLAEIWADYDGVLRSCAPATLLLITRQGLTSSGEAFLAEQPNMRHQTIWQLEDEVLGMTEYTRALAGLFDEKGLSTYYVSGRMRRAHYEVTDNTRALDPVAVDAQSIVRAWIASDDYSPMAIVGGYGAGKSSLAKLVVSEQAKLALRDPHQRRPILIPLSTLSRYTDVQGVLAGLFTYEHPIDGFNVRRFLGLSDKGRFVVVLDGFDEMKHAMTWPDFRGQIASLNRLTESKAKVLLLGRPSAFTSADEHLHVLRGVKRLHGGWRKLPDWPEFQEYELSPFTPEDRRAFVSGYLRYTAGIHQPQTDILPNWVETRAAEVNALAGFDEDMFSKPVHVKVLSDLAADPKVDLSRFAEGVSRWELYETFFLQLAEREIYKEARRAIADTERLAFLRELAYWLWTDMGSATDFFATDIPDHIFPTTPGDGVDIETLRREYLVGSFLEKKTADIYYFGHRSFVEFLVAWRMVHKAPTSDQHATYSRLFKDGVQLFLQDATDKTRIRRWAETVDDARGALNLNYLAYITRTQGGISAIDQYLNPGSAVGTVLHIIDEGELANGRFTEPSKIVNKTVSFMQKTDNLDAFLNLANLVLVVTNASASDLTRVLTAIALMISQKAQQGKSSSDPSSDDLPASWRMLASSIFLYSNQPDANGNLMVDAGMLVRAIESNRIEQRVSFYAESSPSIFGFSRNIVISEVPVFRAMDTQDPESLFKFVDERALRGPRVR